MITRAPQRKSVCLKQRGLLLLRVCEWRRYVTEHNRVVVLPRLSTTQWCISATRRIELIFADVCNARGEGKEEALNGDDISSRDSRRRGAIGGSEAAPGKRCA